MKVAAVLVCGLASAALGWAAAGLPPVLDRELFFGNPEITRPRLSPDGKYIGFIKPLNGTKNIWVKRIEEPFAAAKPVTNDKRPIANFFWTVDGKYILFVQDHLGDENFNVFAANPADSTDAAHVPNARNLTGMTGVRASIYDVPESTPGTIHIGLNDRDQFWSDLYDLNIQTGERTLVRKNTDRVEGWIFDHSGHLRLATRSAENGDFEVLRVDPDGLRKIYSCDIYETCDVQFFHQDGKRVWLETSHGAGDLTRISLLDVSTGKEEIVHRDPKHRVDLGWTEYSNLTFDLTATLYIDERVRYYFRDKAFEADFKLIRQKVHGADIMFLSKTKDERTWLISTWKDIEPGEVYLFQRDTKQLTLQYRVREKLPREFLAEMKSIRYKSSDGLEIQAFLTLPKGVAAKHLPLIVFPHGGPWNHDDWRFDSYAQLFANRGYAVLQPNFRGSSGLGKKFLNAGNREWGDKMQDDLTWGVKHLIAQGIVDPKRVGIMGLSYGGYAALAGVAFTPDLYAVAVACAAPSNLITHLANIPPSWESDRAMFNRRVGDPSTEDGKAQLVRQSPVNSVEKIKTPLMIVHGAHDSRVVKAEADQIVVALRDRGFPVEYLLAPDEGHGFARPVNNMAMIMAIEKFLAVRLGGRYQEDGTPEVMARLKEITVDPKTVVVTKR